MNICMVFSYSYFGGAEKQAVRLARELISRGNNVLILTRWYRGLKKYEKIDGLAIYRLFTLGKGKLASLILSFGLLFYLWRMRNKYQVIHCHLLSTLTVLSLFMAKLLKKQVIAKLGCSGHYGDVWTIQHEAFLGPSKLRYLVRNIDRLICPSQETREELLGCGTREDKITVIPNGIDAKKFKPVVDIHEKNRLKEELGIKSRFTITFVGRLVPQKGVNILLQAFKNVSPIDNETQLLIMGSGYQEDFYRRWATDNNLAEQVIFMGETEEISKYLQACDLFILPSLAEGLSNALLESMATGLPVVATRVGGTKDIIENNVNGILVEPKNSRQIAQAISSLIKDQGYAHRLGRNARKTIEKKYSLSKIGKEYIQLYSQLLKEK